MKKFLTLALALVMALALAAPAMAFASSSVDMTIDTYEWDFYLVDWDEGSTFNRVDAFLTALPEADRGYVHQEVVAAIVEATVPAGTAPEGTITITVTSKNVSFDYAVLMNATIDELMSAETYTANEYNLTVNTTGTKIQNNPKYSVELFTNDGTSDRELQWLVRGRVKADDASLSLKAELKAAGGVKMVLDGANIVTSNPVALKVDGVTYTAAGLDDKGTQISVTKPKTTAAADGFYKITSNKNAPFALYIVHDDNYIARAMYIIDSNATATAAYVLDSSGRLWDPPGDYDYKTDEGTTLKQITDFTDQIDTLMTTNATEVTNRADILNFVATVCDALDLDPAGVNRRLKPAWFSTANTNDGERVIDIEIQPWEAYVRIPDVAVVDPPQTGDTETIAGFVMIVLAAAGTVVFKKVRA